MSALTTIYIVRHGESEWNVQNRLQGQSDSGLTKKGAEQASKLALTLQQIHFDAIFSSDLERAHRTAEIIAIEHKLAVRSTELLRERNFSIYEGRNYREDEELKRIFHLYNTAIDKDAHAKQIGIETENDVLTRFITFLREIALLYPGKTILAVSHSGIMKQFLNHLGYLTEKELSTSHMKNTAYIRIETDGVDFFIREVNGIKKDSNKNK